MRKKALSLLVALTLALCFGTGLAYASPDGEGGGLAIGTQATGDYYAVTFTVTSPDGIGVAPTVAQQDVKFGEHATQPTVAAPEGYVLDGWYANEACTGAKYDFASATVTANAQLYAKITPIEYKIAFDANKPAGVTATVTLPSDVDVTYNQDASIPADVPTLDGYRFLGWWTTATPAAEDTLIQPGGKLAKPNYKSKAAESQTLYAIWVQTFAVDFEMNGHGTAIDAQIVDSGAVVAEPTAPKETGYTFGGWYTDAACADANAYDFAAQVTEAKTLYAKWTADKHTVKFDKNGADGTETMADMEITYGETAQNLTKNAFTYTGHHFVEWATIADTKGKSANTDYIRYDDQGLISNITEDTTLYAQWAIDTFTVKFDTDGHSAAIADQTVEYNAKAEKPADPVNEQYEFMGWYTADQFSDLGARTLKDDAVAFDLDNTAITADVTLYAKWDVKKYDVTFDMQGHGTEVEKQSIQYGYTATEPTAPKETGYTFGGWYTDAACADADAYDFATQVTEAKTLYAKWTADKHVVKFEKNDTAAQGTMEDFEVVYDEAAKKLPENAFTNTGKHITKWTTEADISGKTEGTDYTVYALDAEVSNLTADITLYAQWETNTYKVTFDLNNADLVDPSAAPAEENVEYGAQVAEPTAPTSKSHTFDAWYAGTKNDETGEVTLDANPYDFTNATVTADTVLYAKWNVATHTVTFSNNIGSYQAPAITGASNAPAAATVEYGKTVADPAATMTSDNYVFKGWYTGTVNPGVAPIILADEPYDFETAVTADVTLYAKWAEAVKVKFVDEDETTVLKAEGLVEKDTVPEYGADDPATKQTDTEERTFKGWKVKGTDEVYATADLPKVTADTTTFVAVYNDPETRYYAIAWVDGDGNKLLDYTQEFDTPITYAGDGPTKKATPQYTYTFNGKWNDGTNDIDTSVASFTGFGKVSKDVTYTAQFDSTLNEYQVSFVTQDGIDAPASQTVPFGGYVGEPKSFSVDAATGYVFDGWFADEAMSKPFDFAAKLEPEEVGAEVKVYAKLTATPEKAAYDEAAAAAAEAADKAAEAKAAADKAAAAAEAAAATAAADKAAADKAAATPGDAAVAAAKKASESAAAAETAAKAAEDAAAAYKAAAETAKTTAEAASEAAKAANSGVSADEQAALATAAETAATAATDAVTAADTAAAATKTAATAATAAKTAQTTASTAAKAAADKAAADKAAAAKAAADKAAADKAAAAKAAADKAAAEKAAAAKKAAAKKANTMTVKAKTIKAKAKKKTTFKKAKAFTVKKAKGKVTFKKIKGNKKITISKAGKVTVKKGLKKGKTYKVKVKVTAAGNKSYKALSKTVTLKVKVK